MRSKAVRIGIVAGEPSGDKLGAGLIKALLAEHPRAEFVGIGGPKMRQVGCDTLYDMERIELMGIDGLFGKLGDILKIRAVLYRKFVAQPPDLFIGIDAPDFNLTLERKLKKKNIRTVHYVSPTVWAWRGYRIHKIRRAVDHMLTLFPFEAEFYQRHKIPVTCVGHPLADEIGAPDRAAARKKIGMTANPDGKVIALLPGSRRSEVRRLGALFVEVAEKMYKADATVQFVLPFASAQMEKIFYAVAGSVKHLPVFTLNGQSRDAIEASDIVVLASGTAALEAALLRRPHVVVYKLSPMTYWLFQKLRHVDYCSMPNQLLPEPVIPELVQDQATADNIVHAVNELMSDPKKARKLERDFSDLHQQLKRNANVQASEAIMKLLES
ncbi:lipid-A-disaccharide synthase [Candidatus Spongiihabitans sp.]|uniref:lipid-A-disaccharide synthase n=1 Tax=Candidatus Spongiihabitans sp. TaxID=3101308 RepID=UPI003C7A3229